MMKFILPLLALAAVAYASRLQVTDLGVRYINIPQHQYAGYVATMLRTRYGIIAQPERYTQGTIYPAFSSVGATLPYPSGLNPAFDNLPGTGPGDDLLSGPDDGLGTGPGTDPIGQPGTGPAGPGTGPAGPGTGPFPGGDPFDPFRDPLDGPGLDSSNGLGPDPQSGLDSDSPWDIGTGLGTPNGPDDSPFGPDGSPFGPVGSSLGPDGSSLGPDGSPFVPTTGRSRGFITGSIRNGIGVTGSRISGGTYTPYTQYDTGFGSITGSSSGGLITGSSNGAYLQDYYYGPSSRSSVGSGAPYRMTYSSVYGSTGPYYQRYYRSSPTIYSRRYYQYPTVYSRRYYQYPTIYSTRYQRYPTSVRYTRSTI